MSRGREQSCSRTREEGEEQDEDFYDCQETLEPPEPRGGGQGKEEKEIQQDFHIKDRQTEEADTERETGGGQQEEEQGGELNEEEEMKKEVSAPVESNEEYLTEVEKEEGSPPVEFEEEYLTEVEKEDLKEEVSPPVEFDDEYLKEVEKELTEEEKERRRQQSLSLKEAGNALFKKGEWSEAGCSYTEALSVCPVSFSKERAVLFSNRAAARMHQDLKEAAISDCSRAIDLDPDYLRALLRRAELYEQTEKLDEALEDYQKVLERDPNNTSARCAVMRLPRQIQERNEKLKEEMISKLKDLGNMVLRPFGLSTSNFQVNQDAASGSYSINFVQNPNNNNR